MSTKQRLIEQAGFSTTFEGDRLGRLIDLVVAECIDSVKNSSQDHCNTTYDQEQRDATVARCVQSMHQQFLSD